MKSIVLIFFTITSIYSQINLSNATFGNLKDIPTLSANLKPEFQSAWNNSQFTGYISDLKIQTLRWPGAVGANYFDWEKGKMLPCYKWNNNPCSCDNNFAEFCLDGNDNELNGCSARTLQVQFFNNDANGYGPVDWADNVNDNSSLVTWTNGYNNYPNYSPDSNTDAIIPVEDDVWFSLQEYDYLNSTSYDLNNFPILLSKNGNGMKRVNNNENKASDYVNTMSTTSTDFKPFFVLNIYNPEYIDPQDVIDYGNLTSYPDCSFNTQNIDIYNSITQQLTDIQSLAQGYSEYYIQLGNETWNINEYDENTFPCARAYVEKMVEIAALIKGQHELSSSHPYDSWDFSNAKIGIFADAHAPEIRGDICLSNHISQYDPDEWASNWSCDVDFWPQVTQSAKDYNYEVYWDKRCEWNEAIRNILDNPAYDASNLFDAISFHKYYGASNFRVPCVSEFDLNANGIIEADEQINVNNMQYPDWCEVKLGEDDNEYGDIPWGVTNNSQGLDQNGTNYSDLNIYDYYFLDYAVKWLAINLDIQFDHWDGGGGYEGLYHSLNPSHNLDIWITEYDFEPENGKREWVGTWPHALAFLYNTLRYMEEVPNIKLLSPNNLIGYAGSYRLLDTYSCLEGMCNIDPNESAISCYYQEDATESDCTDRCEQVYTGLSPKGEVMRLLNELIVDEGNNTIKRITFDSSELPTTEIYRANPTNIDGTNTQNFDIQEIQGWEFGNISGYKDYLFINLSNKYYDIHLFDYDCTLEIQNITSSNLFAKNYYFPNADASELSEWYDTNPRENILWEFRNNPEDVDLMNYFAATAHLEKNEQIINHGINSDLITLTPYSVTQVKTSDCLNAPLQLQGDLNNDGIINIIDIIDILNIILANGEYDSIADLNQDGTIDTIDVINVMNLILGGN